MIKKILLSLITLSVMAHPYFAYADEITVSGNGEGSTNNVNISGSSTTEVQQTNTAEINNNVDINANTGNNTADQNTGGETSITTGDVIASSQIINAGINQSSVSVGCCQDSTDINISGNGSDSNNSVEYSQDSNTNVTVNNTANIYNSVNGYANTGYNSANQNNGSVSILTGNIKATDVIKNNSINIYEVNAANGGGGSVYISVDGNGAESNNSVKFADNNNVNINVNNTANIENSSDWDLNTGYNDASGNTGGDVSIATGDIVFQSTIENTDVNIGLVDVECCEEEKGPPPDGTPPSNPPTNNNGGGQGGSSSSTSTASVLGQILPVTGNYSMLLFMIGNIAMLFLGGYLRLRSGRSPNYLFAR